MGIITPEAFSLQYVLEVRVLYIGYIRVLYKILYIRPQNEDLNAMSLHPKPILPQ